MENKEKRKSGRPVGSGIPTEKQQAYVDLRMSGSSKKDAVMEVFDVNPKNAEPMGQYVEKQKGTKLAFETRKEALKETLMESAPEAIKIALEMMRSPGTKDADKIKIIKDVLDRIGLVEKQDQVGGQDAFGDMFNEWMKRVDMEKIEGGKK